MEYLVRFTQVHETFRLAEIEALAALENIKLEIVSYSPTVSILPNFVCFILTISSRLFV